MTRFEKTPTPLPYLTVVASLVIVFVVDLYSPLGIAAWVLYLVPIAVSYYVWRPAVPALIALAVTMLTVAGHALSSPGIDVSVARINRGFGVAAAWALAILGYQFIRAKLGVRKEEWLQQGQTQLSAQMAGDPELVALGEKVLNFLCKYLSAQGGAIYFENVGEFRRFATCGVPTDAAVPQTFQHGDGLLGRAVLEQQVVTLQDLPDDYLVVGSALGRSKPRTVLIAPFLAEEKVHAVAELGFFEPTQTTDRALLARVSESVAVAVRSAHDRTKLRELLEETQRQAEELQTQSEELRVNNEELEEQGRALREYQDRLESQQVELEETNAQLEEQAQMLEQQKDEMTSAKTILETQARELLQASKYKTEFLANMSHELRTPLNASLILARQLADNRHGNLTPDQVKHAATIEAAGKDLLALINDVLDLAKVEAGHLEVHPQVVNVARIVDNLRSTFQTEVESKRLRLYQRIGSDVPETIETDQRRLEQVLKNLLSNALKFTEDGEVELDIRVAADQRIAFSVRDTGIGIDPAQHDIIFEPFCQADGTTNRKYGGTGLGLSICRQLAQLLGGEIKLKSAVGEGSTFTVLLPLRYDASTIARHATVPERFMTTRFEQRLKGPATTSKREALPAPSIEDDREHLTTHRRIILIVEDDEPFVRILYDLAHELDFHALIATSSAEALALAVQYSPSAVVLDIGLPDDSGLLVLDRLKNDARTRHIPVHIVSMHDYMETALSLGAVGYMLKPVKREQLIEAFRRLESRLSQPVRRVLIVEDDPAQRESLCTLLGAGGAEIIGVGTSTECLERLATTTFDCMVLDLSLPDASGFTLLDRLSQEDRYSFPPVIVYTGRDLSRDDEERLRRYSKSIIVKGAKSAERLLDEVTLFLHQVVSELPPEHQAMLDAVRRRDATLEGRQILVVEDDVRNVFALTSLLEPYGAKVRIARNGREALEALAKQINGDSFDLVLMDVMMPEMDGLTAVREIRKRAEWRKLPIIILTAKAMKHDQEQALAAGANDYMAKPLNVDKLLSLIRIWMPR